VTIEEKMMVSRGPVGFWKRTCTACGYATVNGVPVNGGDEKDRLPLPVLRDAFRVPRGEGLPRGCLSQQYGQLRPQVCKSN